jgi:hypothetical protein
MVIETSRPIAVVARKLGIVFRTIPLDAPHRLTGTAARLRAPVDYRSRAHSSDIAIAARRRSIVSMVSSSGVGTTTKISPPAVF